MGKENGEGVRKPLRLSRRNAIKALVFGTAGAAIALASRKHEQLPSGSSEYVQVPQKGYFLPVKKEDGRPEVYEISAVPDGFYDALIYIAKKEKGNAGLEKLYSFLNRKPLKIEFPQSSTESDQKENHSYYIPSIYTSGPKIIFANDILEPYITKFQSEDLVTRLFAPEGVYQELYHVWQDVRDPFGTICDHVIKGDCPISHIYGPEIFSGWRRDDDAIQFLKTLPPYEIESVVKSVELIEERAKLGLHGEGKLENFFVFNIQFSSKTKQPCRNCRK